MSPIGRLESEGDLERFVADRSEQQNAGFRAQIASLVQGQQAGVLASAVATGEASASAPYVDLATAGPELGVSVVGTYVVLFGAMFSAGSAVTPYVGLHLNGTLGAGERRETLSTASGIGGVHGVLVATLAVGDVLLVRYGSQGAISVTFSNRYLVALRLSS